MSEHETISAAEAADRLAIRELVEAYAHCADRRDAKGQVSLFTADNPWASSLAPSGSGPTCDAGPAPWVLPKLWPPAISATVSSSFIAMRLNVSRMSKAALSGSGLPSGPSGLT